MVVKVEEKAPGFSLDSEIILRVHYEGSAPWNELWTGKHDRHAIANRLARLRGAGHGKVLPDPDELHAAFAAGTKVIVEKPKRTIIVNGHRYRLVGSLPRREKLFEVYYADAWVKMDNQAGAPDGAAIFGKLGRGLASVTELDVVRLADIYPNAYAARTARVRMAREIREGLGLRPDMKKTGEWGDL